MSEDLKTKIAEAFHALNPVGVRPVCLADFAPRQASQPKGEGE